MLFFLLFFLWFPPSTPQQPAAHQFVRAALFYSDICFGDSMRLRLFNDTGLGVTKWDIAPDASWQAGMFLTDGGLVGQLVESGKEVAFDTPGGAQITVLGTEFLVAYDPI